MKVLFLAIFLNSTFSIAQKPNIDSSVFNKWPGLYLLSVSSEGKYSVFIEDNYQFVLGRSLLIIQSMDSDWRVEIPNASGPVYFTGNNKYLLFRKSKDSMGIIELGKMKVEYISKVISFAIGLENDPGGIVYLLDDSKKTFVIKDIENNRERSFYDVTDYTFGNQRRSLLLMTSSSNNHELVLQFLDITQKSPITIWKGNKAYNFIFDRTDNELAFHALDDLNGKSINSIWYYMVGTDSAIKLADDQSYNIGNNTQIASISRFNNDGTGIFFKCNQTRIFPGVNPNRVKVDVWTYRDPKLQSQQLTEAQMTISISSIIHIREKKIIRLQGENEELLNSFYGGQSQDSIILIKKNNIGDIDHESNWNSTALTSVYMKSTLDGSEKLIAKNIPDRAARSYSVSPHGNFVIYYDSKQRNYFSYSTRSGIVLNITKRVKTNWTDSRNVPDKINYVYGVVGWTEDEKYLMLYDQFDIYLVSPKNILPIINLTERFGRINEIVFRFAKDDKNERVLNFEGRCILTAFSQNDKLSGFYAVKLSNTPHLQKLSMQPYSYYGLRKAKDRNVYLIGRMSCSTSMNYCITSNFKIFKSVTNFHPESNYNWITSELITWHSLDGIRLRGILYKPENFDKRKKYPIIFQYYERRSDQLNNFIPPGSCKGEINIPYFVSNGYLVFEPDIYFGIGKPGENVYSAVVPIAKSFSKEIWIDRSRMGIIGHSFGGFETDYLITHTHMFAAAVSSAGVSDFISCYGSISDIGYTREDVYEQSQSRMGVNLWVGLKSYLNNSSVLRSNSVSTPLLLQNNIDDRVVPFDQGIEFFTALRRLGKKVWLLQYDGEGHGLTNADASLDYTIRLTQFFDHYLKGKLPPKWMTKGIPAVDKGINLGYELDSECKEPGAGLLVR